MEDEREKTSPAGRPARRRLWRIRGWRELYAVRPADEDAEKYAAMYPMRFVRDYLPGATTEGAFCEAQRRAIVRTGGYELLGIAEGLKRLAAQRDRENGGLVDHLGLPASLTAIAESMGLPVTEARSALKALSRAEVGFCECVPAELHRDTRRRGGGPTTPAGGSGDGHAWGTRGDDRESDGSVQLQNVNTVPAATNVPLY